tara:strand:- start:2099 stop:3298 length:1200 start_codon:yes stop_codon:yes gene_type:complete
MIRRILSTLGYEKRAVDFNPAFVPGAWATGISPTNYASADAVLSNSAVACRAIELKATLIASTALKLFTLTDNDGRERVRDHALARIIRRPNDNMTGYEFLELMSRSLDLHGNFYSRVTRDASGEVEALWPIHPTAVTVERVNGSNRLRYKITEPGGITRVLLDTEVLHVKNSTTDGVMGQSPLQLARASLSLVIAQSQTAESLASNGLRPAGYLSHPGKLSATAKTNISDSIMSQSGGPANAGKPLVLEEGMEMKTAAFSAEDAQFLESRQMAANDVCRIFGVPPSSLGLVSTVSYGSAAQAAQDLLTATLNPLAARIETALERALLPADSDMFFEFDLDSLLRADPSVRWTNYLKGRQANAISPNDIRRFENLPTIEGGDDYSFSMSAPQNGDGNAG